MESLLNNPVVQSSLLPLLVSLIVAGIVGFGLPKGTRLAAMAVPISALITIIAISGLSFPPKASSQKLPYLIVAAGLIGVLFDYFEIRGRHYKLACLLLPLPMIVWVFGARFNSIDLSGVFFLTAVWFVATYALWQGEQRREQIDTGLKALFFSGGLGVILLLGSSGMLAQTALGLMAAVGGFLLWNWPKFRFSIGASMLFPMVTILSAMAAQGLFFTKASGTAMAFLVPLLLIDRIVPHIPFLKRATTPLMRPLSLAVVALVCLTIPVGSALLLTETSSYGY